MVKRALGSDIKTEVQLDKRKVGFKTHQLPKHSSAFDSTQRIHVVFPLRLCCLLESDRPGLIRIVLVTNRTLVNTRTNGFIQA